MQKLESPELKAVFTYKKDMVNGAVPIFKALNEREAEVIAEKLGKILQSVVHDLENGVYVIVKH